MIVPAKKLVLITLRDFERRVVRRLGELGVVHFRRLNLWEARELLEVELERAKELEEACVKLAEIWHGLYRSGLEEESIFRRYVEVRDELRRLYASRAELRRLRDIISGIKAMGEDEVPPTEPGAELSTLLITIPKEVLGKLITRIEGLGAVVKHAELPGNEALIYVVALKDKVDEAREALEEIYHQEIVLPDYLPRRCDEALSQLDIRLPELERRISELEMEFEEVKGKLLWTVDEGGEYALLSALRGEILRLREELSLEGRAEGAGDMSIEEAKRILGEISEKYDSIRRRLDQIRHEREELEKVRSVLSLLSEADVKLPEIGHYENLAIFIGVVGEHDIGRLEEALRGRLALMEALAAKNGRALLAVTCLREHAAEINEILHGSGFESITHTPAELLSRPSEGLEEVSKRLEALKAEEEELLEELMELRRSAAPKLMEIHGALELNLRLEEALMGSLQTDYLRIIQGWVPADIAGWLSEKLEEMRRELKGVVAYRLEEPKPGEKAPTQLRNPRIFKVFESIVALYGWPDRREIDPTMISGVLWTVMFGLMFPDLGQGLAIIGMGLFFIHALKGRRILGLDSGKIGRLMMGMGLSASLFGALFGELFLIEIQPILPGLRPGWLGDSSSIIWLLKVAIFFGMAQILLAITLSALKELRNGEIISAIFSHHGLAGLLAYIGFALTAFHFLGITVIPGVLEFPDLGVGALLSWPFFTMMGGLAMMILKPILEKGEMALGMGSLLEAITAFLANTLSYARIAGFAIVHAALAMVVHEMMHASPAMGIGLGLILLNLVSLSIELLVVSIQALRLLFYEFYSKFYEGAGTPYRPWRL